MGFGGGETEFEGLLQRQHFVVGRGQALRMLSAGAIDRKVAAKRWQRPHRGVYVTHSGPLDHEQRRWIAVLGTVPRRRVPLAGLSALETVGFRGFPSEVVHVLVPATLTPRSPPSGVKVHRTSRLRREDLDHASAPPGTMPARSLIDAAQWASSDQRARAIIAAGFQQRLVGVEEMSSALAVMPRAKRRALVLATMADSAAGAHSLPELDLLRICRKAGLPEPKLQFQRRDRAGRRRCLDAYFVEYGVHVEVDGAGHLDRWQWWDDMRRQNDLWIAGDRVLRFPSWVIRSKPEETARQIRLALIAAGWSPSG